MAGCTADMTGSAKRKYQSASCCSYGYRWWPALLFGCCRVDVALNVLSGRSYQLYNGVTAWAAQWLAPVVLLTWVWRSSIHIYVAWCYSLPKTMNGVAIVVVECIANCVYGDWRWNLLRWNTRCTHWLGNNSNVHYQLLS